MSEQLLQMQEILRKSLAKIKKLESELEEAKAAAPVSSNEPIAIVGLGCRFPGGVRNLKNLWQLLLEKKDAVVAIPKDRWDNDAIYDPDPLKPGKTHATKAAFLEEDVRAFDADFFGIVPREAKSIDPLQRMILEVVYEALEEAGIASESLKGTNTAVYIAIGNSDYIQARFRSGNLETMDVYDATGIPFATAAGRVSYLYDLQGPNFALDAACASSIVGLHLAAESLRKGESDTAIVASANLLLTPELFVGLSKLGSLSASGQCKAFADDADGYVRGEGCGVAVLKRKSDAIAENNAVHAFIIGSAVKHDGLSNGFTAPNPKAQLDTVRAAILQANIDVNDVSFVEAHGIGNKFTDAMEIQAIGNGYKGRNTPIYVGSLKPNIGHLEAAIGMAMLFKVIGTLKYKTIAPNIYFDTPNSDIPWETLKVQVPTTAISLSESKHPLRAAINLSGYSGTNVHMIFEEAPVHTTKELPAGQPSLFLFSAKSEEALKALAQKYLDEKVLDNNALAEIAYTQQTGRNHLEQKLSIIAADKAIVEDALKAYISGTPNKNISVSNPENANGGDIAFLFTGQGAQYHCMCKEYYEKEAVFKKAVDDCAVIVDPLLEIPIKEILFGTETDTALIDQTAYTQPALFVVEFALAKLWQSKGIFPSAVVGHSIGEFVALVIAEAISLEDGLRLVAIRGKLMQSLDANAGGMAAVVATESEVLPYLKEWEGKVDIAAINAPRVITISGAKDAVAAVCEAMKADKIKSIALQVSHAFHSSLMEPILQAFEQEAAKISVQSPMIPVISNVTAQELQVEDITPQYFSKHLRGTVRFAEDVQYLYSELGIRIFVECGPNPTLSGFGPKIIDDTSIVWAASAKKGYSDEILSLQVLQSLYLAGVKIEWKTMYLHPYPAKVALPTYAWQRKVYWENPVRGITAVNDLNAVQTAKDSSNASKKTQVTKENLMAIMQLEGADTLGLEPGQKLDPNKSLREQGFDSMMSGEYLSRLEKYFDVKLEMSLLHIYGTMNELQRHFIDTYLGGGEVDENAAVTMSDIVFGSDLGGETPIVRSKDWHEIKPTDPAWLKIFKKVDKLISID